MPTVDCHQHLWPEPFVSALAARTRPPRLVGKQVEFAPGIRSDLDMYSYPLDKLLQTLDRDGIDMALVTPSPTLGIESLPADEQAELGEPYHAGIRELMDEAGGRLVATAWGRVVEGFVGTTVTGQALVDRPDWLEPLLTELEESGRFLFVHPSASNPPAGAPRWWRGLFDFTAEMQSAYGAWLVWHGPAHPTLKVLFTILGGGAPFQIERLGSRGIAEETLRSENLFFDTASYGERAIALARDACGRGQIVYGSDLPVIDSTPTLQAVRSLGLHEALDANPARLLAR
jgi:predicted TIM-barrel fold metal-dependent hydrolase